MKIQKRHIILLVGVVLGAIGGFIYWKQIGCVSGSCAISSSPINSTIYGAVLGGYLFSYKKKSSKEKVDL